MDQKNNLTVVIVVIIILAVIAIIALKNRKQEVTPSTLTQTEIELNNAVKSDTTASIKTELDSITIEDTTGDEDLKIVDKELQSL